MHITARNNSIKAGFTLIEILMVISIIMLMTGALLPSFSNYLERQTMIQGVELFKSDIRTVQNKALAGSGADVYLNVGAGPNEHPDYWGIQFRSGDSTHYYAIVSFEDTSAVCDNNNPDVAGETNPSKPVQLFDTYTLPPDFAVTPKGDSGDNSCIFISMRNGDIQTINFDDGIDGHTDVPEDTAKLTLSHADVDGCVEITINPFGLVTNSDISSGLCP
jgi:prepilin-type N-terminal cleavage/methylation domain-containing protein